MLNNLSKQPEDKILGLGKLYRADERPNKIDLGVGVYKDATGLTPVMRAIKAAEKQLWEVENTKTYTSLAGDAGYHKVMADLVLGDSVDHARLSFAATPGGTGAIHQILELTKMTGNPKVWYSDPTWPNHLSIIKHLEIPSQAYRYFDNATGAIVFDGMMADLETAAEKPQPRAMSSCCTVVATTRPVPTSTTPNGLKLQS
jgi:aromatic-amino-acid transaminase